MSNYTLEGKMIFSDKGRHVATLNDDGFPVMAPGMAGPHTRGVQEFLASRALDQKEDPTDEPQKRQTIATAAKTESRTDTQEDTASWAMQTIPEHLLPPFSKQLGVNTPGFREYILQHQLTEKQIEELVKRLSK